MANKIEFTEIRTDTLVVPTSRYAKSQVIYYGDQRYMTFETYKRVPIKEKSGDTFGIIPPGMEYRPDLMSMSVYGTPDFWWRILEFNNIKDVFDFTSGKNIRLPESIFA
jgi:hypothetical protein